ncbi:MAG TPA: hypothetical protein ENH63_16710 [Sulfitobacter litoralis]|uniref:Uncharacterized protein n=1 Tax=Sulfitobacter litoralis TaxID=335975 RepID=A0A7V1FPC0_9RHOB|nr:hypothetical protein [Sulfitobacter litoralis]HDZ53372.1 hypothetical protein [Sulfitobacter litoralis]
MSWIDILCLPRPELIKRHALVNCTYDVITSDIPQQPRRWITACGNGPQSSQDHNGLPVLFIEMGRACHSHDRFISFNLKLCLIPLNSQNFPLFSAIRLDHLEKVQSKGNEMAADLQETSG